MWADSGISIACTKIHGGESMNVKVCAALGMILAAVAAVAQVRPAPPAFVSDVTVNNVTVDVKVLDPRGVPVAGLHPQDFRLFEDGKEQSLTNFLAVAGGRVVESPDAAVVGQPEPRQVVLFFDLYQLIEPDKRAVVRSLQDAIAAGLPPAQTMAVVSFDGTLRVHTAPTASRDKLLEALKVVDSLPAPGSSTLNVDSLICRCKPVAGRLSTTLRASRSLSRLAVGAVWTRSVPSKLTTAIVCAGGNPAAIASCSDRTTARLSGSMSW